jgi:inosose dehydratase
MARKERLAVNPLPWVFGRAGMAMTEHNVRQALADLTRIGYTALHTDVPAGMTVAQYRSMLDEFGVAPAPGYFAADFHVPGKRDVIVERAKAHAGVLAELGVDATFVAGTVDSTRMMRPAVGANGSAERTRLIAETMAEAAEAGHAEGVRFALHPHVAMTVETEEETRAILDQTAGSELGFGPDTGHLLWVGAVPERIISDYADRVVAVHLKDVDLANLLRATRLNDDFPSATHLRHVWTEPGRGVVDFRGVFAALPKDFDGWFVVEVDVPNLPDRVESARASYAYLNDNAYFEEVAA